MTLQQNTIEMYSTKYKECSQTVEQQYWTLQAK